ncbi:MAG: hypothetical protein ACXV2B_08890 [Halobacteriota archaeon]
MPEWQYDHIAGSVHHLGLTAILVLVKNRTVFHNFRYEKTVVVGRRPSEIVKISIGAIGDPVIQVRRSFARRYCGHVPLIKNLVTVVEDNFVCRLSCSLLTVTVTSLFWLVAALALLVPTATNSSEQGTATPNSSLIVLSRKNDAT